MTREEIIRNLEYTMEKHKNDTVSTFDTNISLMCKDILDYLEQEPCEDVVALEFSADIDKPSKYQTKDGKWHDGKIPSVTPKQKMGRWIEGRKEVYKCSACGNYALEWGGKLLESSYCPWCGAKMSENPTGSRGRE